MLNRPASELPVAVIGAGTMGAGIAQVAAQAGHPVRLYDTRESAAAQARDGIAKALAGLVAKGKLDAAKADAAIARITPAGTLAELADAGLVVEAIVENLAVKQQLFADLEALVAPEAVLASNTSSLSITALARGAQRPGRVVGMHFFNPVPLMKLVEVVSGLRTEPAVADGVFKLAQAWGKTAVHARSTPGFIVNRIARPYYAEALALRLEQAAPVATIDVALRGAGFKLGPFELMDLIGHDVNFAVTESVYAAFQYDKRYVPSPVQRELVDGGLLGRKSGEGFYVHPQPASGPEVATAPVGALPGGVLRVSGRGPVADRLASGLAAAGAAVQRDEATAEVAVSGGFGHLQLTDGRCAQQLAAELGQPEVAVFDWSVAQAAPGAALAFAVADSASPALAETAAAVLAAAQWRPIRLGDAPGLAVARTLAMLVNEASDAVLHGVCDEAGADTAMKLGTAWPAGPFEWLAQFGAPAIVSLLDRLDHHYRGERYRTSPRLRQAAWRAN